MNRALWKKAVADAWLMLAVCAALLLLFGWLFVWFTGLFRLGAWSTLLDALPSSVQPMFGVPIGRLASPAGQISMIYVHPVPMLICMGWAVSRGSDAVSGEIGRGTMDLLLSLPVRRASVLLVPAVISTVGAVVLTAALWLGTWLGIATVDLRWRPPAGQFLPGALNLLALTFCLTGLTSLCSSWDHNRWRAMALSVGFYVISFMVWLVARVWQSVAWLRYLSFLTAYEPQKLILLPGSELLTWQYNGTLVALGLLGYVLAAVIFTLRDIPQPP